MFEMLHLAMHISYIGWCNIKSCMLHNYTKDLHFDEVAVTMIQ